MRRFNYYIHVLGYFAQRLWVIDRWQNDGGGDKMLETVNNASQLK